MDHVYVLMIKNEDCEDGWNACEVFLTEESAIQAARDHAGIYATLQVETVYQDIHDPYLFAYADAHNYCYCIYKRTVKK